MLTPSQIALWKLITPEGEIDPYIDCGIATITWNVMEKTEFDLILIEVPSDKKIAILKVV